MRVVLDTNVYLSALISPSGPPDNLIIGTAITGMAGFVVSGNRHLLDLGTYDDIQIVTPRQFLDILDSSA